MVGCTDTSSSISLSHSVYKSSLQLAWPLSDLLLRLIKVFTVRCFLTVNNREIVKASVRDNNTSWAVYQGQEILQCGIGLLTITTTP